MAATSSIDVQANLNEYLGARTPVDRYASFDYCFNYFQSFADEDRVADLAEGAQLEVSCLQLGFYLASWGMYRGSTVRLRRSLAYLAPAIEVIVRTPREVWTADVHAYSGDTCALLVGTAGQLAAAFPEGASETLVTKVMLGVFGSVPAFDTFFVHGFGSRFSVSSLLSVGQFYSANTEIVDRHRVRTLDFATGANTERRYTRAKVVDMIFFIEGWRRSMPARGSKP